MVYNILDEILLVPNWQMLHTANMHPRMCNDSDPKACKICRSGEQINILKFYIGHPNNRHIDNKQNFDLKDVILTDVDREDFYINTRCFDNYADISLVMAYLKYKDEEYLNLKYMLQLFNKFLKQYKDLHEMPSDIKDYPNIGHVENPNLDNFMETYEYIKIKKIILEGLEQILCIKRIPFIRSNTEPSEKAMFQ